LPSKASVPPDLEAATDKRFCKPWPVTRILKNNEVW